MGALCKGCVRSSWLFIFYMVGAPTELNDGVKEGSASLRTKRVEYLWEMNRLLVADDSSKDSA